MLQSALQKVKKIFSQAKLLVLYVCGVKIFRVKRLIQIIRRQTVNYYFYLPVCILRYWYIFGDKFLKN